MTFYHYTCDHGRVALGTTGTVRTVADWAPDTAAKMPPKHAWMTKVSWFTDLDIPDRRGLGLTSTRLECDRMAWRYTATDPTHLQPWLAVARRHAPRRDAADLRNGKGRRPAHWFVSTLPVPVELDRIYGAARLWTGSESK